MSKEKILEKALDKTMAATLFYGREDAIVEQVAINGIRDYVKSNNEKISDEEIKAFVEKVFDEKNAEAEKWAKYREIAKISNVGGDEGLTKEEIMEKALGKAMASTPFFGVKEEVVEQVAFNGIKDYVNETKADITDDEIRAFVDKVYDEDYENADRWASYRKFTKMAVDMAGGDKMTDEEMMDQALSQALASALFYGRDDKLLEQIAINGINEYLKENNAKIPQEKIEAYVKEFIAKKDAAENKWKKYTDLLNY